MATFFVSMIFLTQEHILTTIFSQKDSFGFVMLTKFYKSVFFMPLVAMGFFTLFFKVATSKKISIKRALLGSFAFIICFSVGRTFFWVYLHYAKQELEMSFGNFYTIVVVVLWTYFAQCSLFYGASVAYQEDDKVEDTKNVYNFQTPPPIQEVISEDIKKSA